MMYLPQHDRRSAGMVTGVGFGLLVTGFMLLIYDDEADIGNRKEDRTTCSEDHEVIGDWRLYIGNLIIAGFAFGIGEAAMIDDKTIAEDTLQARGELGGKCYLRNEIEHIFSGRELFFYQVDIDIRFTAGSDAMQEDYLLALMPKSLDSIGTFLLCGG